MDFLSVNTLIIAFTVLVSINAFSNPNMLGKLAHAPYYEARNKEYYRWLTSGFLHGDYMHLLFNMLSLYFFGPLVEGFFELKFGVIGHFIYLLFYLVGIVAASYGTYLRERNNSYFHSIGASGAVSARPGQRLVTNSTWCPRLRNSFASVSACNAAPLYSGSK